ncbi:hypothetical protein LCGC14_2879730, partial [marine sediment metagenome]
MADKPDTAEEGKVAPDPELSQLAAAIVNEEVPVTTEGKDSVSPKDGEAPGEKDTPKGEKPKDSQEKPKAEGEGEKKPGEGEDGGEQEDPLKDLATNKGALKVL